MIAPGKGLLKITGIVYLIFAVVSALMGILGLSGSEFLASFRPEGFIFARALRTYVAPAGAMPVFHVALLILAAYRLFIGIKTYLGSGDMEQAGFLGLLGKIDLWLIILITVFSVFFLAGFSFIWFALSSYIATIMLLTGSAKNDFRPGKADRSEARAAKLFLIPAFLGLTFITYIPLASVFGLSLFEWRLPGGPVFAGFANFRHLFTESASFWPSIRVTVQYAFLTVGIGMVYSMVIALLLNRKLPGRAAFRTIFYLPFIIPIVAGFMTWRMLYSWHGPVNSIVNMLGGDRSHILSNNATIIPALAIVAVWMSGNIIVIKMAGLGNVPRVYQEAAEIDGANAWHRFWKITIPCMTPIIFYNMLMSLVTHMQVFVPSLIMTGGGTAGSPVAIPESYLFMTFAMYREGFGMGFMGRANAISLVFFVLVGIFTAILFATSKSWLFYEGGAPR
ncbi:MAG: sugar ABC transporter permease [Oscillospiraceae bacterium]|nr:sugar ABC transporter permease [Oscillospiraceae bacterium]